MTRAAIGKHPQDMRLLISYFFGPDAIPLGRSLAEAARALGHEVDCFDSQPEPWTHQYLAKHLVRIGRSVVPGCEHWLPGSSAWVRNRRLTARVAAFRPEVILVLLGNSFRPGLVRSLAQRHGVKATIGWWVKDTACQVRERSLVNEFTHFASIGTWRTESGIAHLSAIAADTVRFRPASRPQARDLPLVFVGGWNRRRDPFFRAIADLPLHLYGPHWTKQGFADHHMAEALWGDDLLDTLHRTQVAINVSSFDQGHGAGAGANHRLLDVALCGTLLLSEWSPEVERIYGDLTSEISFRTPAELRHRATALLADPVRCAALALAMQHRAAAQPNYRDLVQRVLALVPPAAKP